MTWLIIRWQPYRCANIFSSWSTSELLLTQGSQAASEGQGAREWHALLGRPATRCASALCPSFEGFTVARRIAWVEWLTEMDVDFFFQWHPRVSFHTTDMFNKAAALCSLLLHPAPTWELCWEKAAEICPANVKEVKGWSYIYITRCYIFVIVNKSHQKDQIHQHFNLYTQRVSPITTATAKTCTVSHQTMSALINLFICFLLFI